MPNLLQTLQILLYTVESIIISLCSTAIATKTSGNSMKQLRSPFNQRQYMLSDSFEVFYYSDTHFSSVDLHSHEYYEFYFFLEGEVSMEIEGSDYLVEPGDMIVIPPGVMHRALILNDEKPYRRFVFWITEGCYRDLIEMDGNLSFIFDHIQDSGQYTYSFNKSDAGELRGKLFTLIDEMHSDRWGKEAGIRLYLEDLLLHINRKVYDNTHTRTLSEDMSWYMVLTDYIREHLNEDLSLERISGDLYISKYYISHLFQQTTGMALHQYIIRKRLEVCCTAILSGDKPTDIYSEYGFRDYSSFYRAFKKEYGASPAEYRELHRVK